jgi:hypothetical protein
MVIAQMKVLSLKSFEWPGPNTGSSRAAAPPLGNQRDLPEMYHNKEGVSPVLPLLLSQTIGRLSGKGKDS